MPEPPADSEDATPADTWTPPEPELVEVPDDLPVLEPSHVITLPLNEQITSAVVVPDEHEGNDVLYVAVSQERVNVWAAVVYFVPEIALGVTGLLILVALRKWWVGRRFMHRKGEAYCKKCWAGLTGVESATCPECGRPVAKTKRIAKRTRRSPLSPRWVWAGVAVIATLGSATIWFGESWHRVWRLGFWPGENKWAALTDYADRDSVFRINKMAGWFDWRSAKIAALARDHDRAWIETLDTVYPEDEGTHFFLAIRRYAIDDGRLLTTHPLPESSQWQNSHKLGGAYLGQVNGVVLVTDGDHFYGLHHGHPDPWLMFVSDDPDALRTITSITLDGRYLVIGFSDADPHHYHAADTQRLVAFDTQKGDAIATLHFMESHIDNPNPAANSATARQVKLEGRQFLGGIAMMEDDTQILIYIKHPSGDTPSLRILNWNFLTQTMSTADVLDPNPVPPDRALIAPYPWSIQSINQYTDYWGDYNSIFELLSREQRFQYWVRREQLSGFSIGWLPIGHDLSWRFHQNTTLTPPYDQYDPLTSVPLYDLATTTSHTQPDRVLEFSHPNGQSPVDIVLSPSGRFSVVRVGDNGPRLAVDVERALALGHLGLSGSGSDRVQFRGFANGDRHLIVWSSDSNPAPPPRHYVDKHEILIFDLPE